METKEPKWVFFFFINEHKYLLGLKSMFYNIAIEHFSVILQE